MPITVKNISTTDVEVCINQWGKDGDTSWFSKNLVTNGPGETWDRTDSRGFVMCVLYKSDNPRTDAYYIHPNDIVFVKDDGVYDNEQRLSPVGRP